MSRLLYSGLAALALGTVSASSAFAYGGKPVEHEVVVAQVNRSECHDLMKRFDATHTSDVLALRMFHKARVNCAETDDFSTSIGVGQMRHALGMALENQANAKRGS